MFHNHKVNHMNLFPQRKSITGSFYGSHQNIEKLLAEADKFAWEHQAHSPDELKAVMTNLSGEHNKTTPVIDFTKLQDF